MVDLVEDKSGEKQPLLIVISGPSGAGKDSVIDEMKVKHVPFHFVVTATTRPPARGKPMELITSLSPRISLLR